MEASNEARLRSVRGMVFDLQRFALTDGPGIRTTIFLKGCPLSCLWCHNPESQSFRPQLSFDPQRCTHCHGCAEVCPNGALTIRNGRLVVNHELCDGCGACVTECPEDAFTIIGREATAGEVLDEVLRDRAYFNRSGGGVTLSGGEPLAQPAFARALLELAKLYGLHTCLDTSGAVHVKRLHDILPFTDLFLYDYKATDSDTHKDLTGVRNEVVLQNLDYLYANGANIILRCPLIAGLNDSADHLEGIANLSRRYPRLRGIEIMAYHNMGRAKAERIGFADPLGTLPSTDESTKLGWLGALHDLGCGQAELG